MQSLPVDKCIDVLNVFCANQHEELWVNKIVDKVNQATGSKDSPKIKNAINILEKAKILKNIKKGKQKIVKVPTPLGMDIIDLLVTINTIHEKFASLINEAKHYEKIIYDEEKARKSKLRNLKWYEKDINNFEDLINTFHFTFEFYTKNIYHLLIYRYLKYTTDPKIHDLSKNVLLRIITKELHYQFDILKEIKYKIIQKDVYVDEDYTETVQTDVSYGISEMLFNSFYIQLHDLINYTYQPINQKIKNLLDDVYISMIQLSGADKTGYRTIFMKKNKPFKIFEGNDLTLTNVIIRLNEFHKIPPYQKSQEEKNTDLRVLYEKAISKRTNIEVKEKIYHMEDLKKSKS